LKNPEELEGLGELQRRVRVKAERLRVNQMQIIQMFRNKVQIRSRLPAVFQIQLLLTR